MKNNTLFVRFIILSMISFLITGLLVAYFVVNLVIEQEIKHNIEIVNITLEHSYKRWLKDVDIDKLTESDFVALDNEFESLNMLGNIADIRIWSNAGSLVYSLDRESLGQLIMEDSHLNEIKSKGSDYELTSANEEENMMLKAFGKEFIEIYLPIDRKNISKGIFEVYRTFDDSRNSINASIRNLSLILSIGLLLLYLLLARVIYTSSKKLLHQTELISDSYDKINRLFKSMVKAITKAIDARDKFTSGHSQRVAELTVGFAKYLELEAIIINRLEIASLLHDIGKLGVPETIINKMGKLTDEEFEVMKQHPYIGEKIIEDIEELEEILEVIMHHHEKYSGGGYPSNLKGEEIPYLARIITITDAYDAMISNRPYRKGLSKETAKEEIYKYSGIQFDPELATRFIDYINQEEPI